MSKNLRTPIIMPRKQGGTFYTFASAMEDIGLNINESHNRIELSHYALLNIPRFYSNREPITETGVLFKAENHRDYDDKIFYDPEHQDVSINLKGDYIFSEYFQNYCLNMEAVVRNQDDYDYANDKTVSERVFWKWVFRSIVDDPDRFEQYEDTDYVYEKDKDNAIVKGFGLISAGSQRTDDSGIYNETFVQIPSSYGQMRVLFKKNIDENYIKIPYIGGTSYYIENISNSEVDASNNLYATSISAISTGDSHDSSNHAIYYVQDDQDVLEIELDINELRKVYKSDTLTYDDLGMGKNQNANPIDASYGDFDFNAILVYYSVYNSDKTKRLATNAYGVYLLDNSLLSGSDNVWYFPSVHKEKSGTLKNGSSYSFRINIKPSSAYSGDITVADNSTAAFSMSEDFNDVLRNLTSAINTMKSNARTLYKIVQDNEKVKSMAASVKEQVDDLEVNVNNIKNGNFPYTASNIYYRESDGDTILSSTVAKNILDHIQIKYNSSDSKLNMYIDTSNLSGDSLRIAKGLQSSINNGTYDDMLSIIMLLIARVKGTTSSLARSLVSSPAVVNVSGDKSGLNPVTSYIH